MDKEYIDGPIERDMLDHEELAKAVALELGAFAMVAIREGAGDENYRLVAWVEKKEDILGYALALEQPVFTNTGGFDVNARYYVTNRDQRTVITETPIALSYSTTPSNEMLTELMDRMETFETDDLENIFALLGKAAMRFADDADSRPRNAGSVLVAMAEPNLDELAQGERRRRTNERENSVPEEIIERMRIVTEDEAMADESGHVFMRMIAQDYTCVMNIFSHESSVFAYYAVADSRGNHTCGSIGLTDEEDPSQYDFIDHTGNDTLPAAILPTLMNGKKCKESSFDSLYEQAGEAAKDEFEDSILRSHNASATGMGKNRSADI